MPDDTGRDALYDHEKEPRRHVADWGGDELFTRTPRRRAVHAAPPPRMRRPAPEPRDHGRGRFRRDEERDEELPAPVPEGPLVAETPIPTHTLAPPPAPGERRTVVISGRPEGAAPLTRARRRPPRTAAERVGPRPERIVAWAFALGLVLIPIAIATADAATV